MLRSLLKSRQVICGLRELRALSTSQGNESIIDFVDTVTETSEAQNQSFASLLRNSKFMQLGDFNGRLVVGKIAQRVQEDVYIDFGLKFNAVCKVPALNSEAYRSGARVLIRLIDPELSERFLGSKHDLTLLEADAVLVRLLSNVPRQQQQRQKPRGATEEEAPAAPETPAAH
ncbi:Mitochondrial Ribosomal Protein, Small [Caenorhabditis elegans]|uniref:Mitochondrial Ribosomal Protein, Small n=1 Tax=Caenorhabditis elegans TaxID=6239 RepID=Q9XWP0_CAEEL|nr:Mitochondrial Ribosomal Protein, Small [Caenorhabditis elegans]CAA21611.1 Mitochondrial Ribosomal Protein, Small [Caenorhabditis elegans]|eukprot:NP_507808.1 Mitochondrial Ribosomal Protein, Small [Caenorhabditis elegans]